MFRGFHLKSWLMNHNWNFACSFSLNSAFIQETDFYQKYIQSARTQTGQTPTFSSWKYFISLDVFFTLITALQVIWIWQYIFLRWRLEKCTILNEWFYDHCVMYDDFAHLPYQPWYQHTNSQHWNRYHFLYTSFQWEFALVIISRKILLTTCLIMYWYSKEILDVDDLCLSCKG